MSGTVEGGKAAAKRNKELYGDDYYSKIGKIVGGANGKLGSFFTNRELARRAGAIGGRRSKRGPATHKKERVDISAAIVKEA